jgi:hypothetical protein
MASLVGQISELLKSTMTELWRSGGTKNPYPYNVKLPKEKRKNKPHALDSAFTVNNIFMINPEMNYFEIGNPRAERITPHYHILEDAKIIRNPYKSTKRSRGSQGLVKDRSKRDYSVLIETERTREVVQEYRNPKAKYSVEKGGFRENKYYGYIENLVMESAQVVANTLKLRFSTEKDSTIPVGELRRDIGRITNGNL